MKSSLWLSLALVCVLFAPGTGYSNAPPGSPYNPKPAEGDVVVPMPNGGEMVFRAVVVPGKTFWGDVDRIIQIGDASGGIFEGLQRAHVSGSFLDEEGKNWVYFLGKYEVTKGQFAAVMGLDRLVDASGDSDDQRLKTLSGAALQEALRKPLAFVGWHDMEEFIYRYNRWLFDEGHPERLRGLPRIEGVPGFIRLPTEIEWEYAARGGHDAKTASKFRDQLPFPASKLDEYSWNLRNAKNSTRMIGLRRPTGAGFYDMFGNVQELATGVFFPEYWQGKPGGLVARGGSVATAAPEIRSSRREEVEIYRWDPSRKAMREQRSFSTGLRLAIGSNVLATPATRERLEKEYQDYLQKVRDAMPSGESLKDPYSVAGRRLTDARAVLDDLTEKNPALQEDLALVNAEFQKAEEKLAEGEKLASRSAAEDGFRYASRLAHGIYVLEKSVKFRLRKARELAAKWSRFSAQAEEAEKDVKHNEETIGQDIQDYARAIEKLDGYSPKNIQEALMFVGKQPMGQMDKAAFSLLKTHVQEYQGTRRPSPDEWLAKFRETFGNFSG